MIRKIIPLLVIGIFLSINASWSQIRVIVADPEGLPLPYVNSILVDEASNFNIIGKSVMIMD